MSKYFNNKKSIRFNGYRLNPPSTCFSRLKNPQNHFLTRHTLYVPIISVQGSFGKNKKSRFLEDDNENLHVRPRFFISLNETVEMSPLNVETKNKKKRLVFINCFNKPIQVLNRVLSSCHARPRSIFFCPPKKWKFFSFDSNEIVSFETEIRFCSFQRQFSFFPGIARFKFACREVVSVSYYLTNDNGFKVKRIWFSIFQLWLRLTLENSHRQWGFQ